MRLEERAVPDAFGTILMHNVADTEGKRTLKKGIRLTQDDLDQLAEMGYATVEVAVLDADDVHEDEAAVALAEAMQTEQMSFSRPTGGRVNLRCTMDGLLEVDAERLLEVNLLPGFALATRRHHTVVGPNQETDNLATLKIVPYAVSRADMDRALELASARPGIVEIRPFQPDRRVAMLFVAEPAAQDRTRDQYLPPTQARLERLGAKVVATEAVPQDESAIAQAAASLVEKVDVLIIAGQTSVIHEDDTTLRALRQAGAETTLSGAPVEPGNLLALAYFPGTPTGTPAMCAPGCAKGPKRNVVDLVLPRLLLGDRLERRDIAALGLGGFLTAAERAGDIT
ncbi:MAG TPA: molybdopterin-binding protein [Anaerolineae bacterium]|nr:molybdopterin-binding protein [Anaerolineae bacterium]